MQIIQIPARGFGANTYVLTADNTNAIVIDPAQSRVAAEVEKLGLQCRYVLLTHCHFDHVGGVPALQEKGAKVLCGEAEKPLVGKFDLFEHFGAPREGYVVNETFADLQTRELCGMRVQALHTPGHTAGGVCYLVRDEIGKEYLFTGDTLFAGTIGRTDFPTGDFNALCQSLRRLRDLPGDYPVYPGHQEITTLEKERKTNAFLRG